MDFRRDIRNKLPDNLDWKLCSLDASDCCRLHIISSDDWGLITKKTFTVVEAVRALDAPWVDKDSTRLISDIQAKIDYINEGQSLDFTLIGIADSICDSGKITLIEGNRRAVAFTYLKMAVRIKLYLGIAEEVKDCFWARHTYQDNVDS